MAMVVWLFAGGGYSELYGLIPFLKNNYPNHQFQRKTPARPNLKKKDIQKNRFYASQVALGQTGKQFSDILKNQLEKALMSSDQCDLIFVLDDLDCKDATEMEYHFKDAIVEVPGAGIIDQLIGFASPEMEAWLIADWDNSFASHTDFNTHEAALNHNLSTTGNVDFSDPEAFSCYDAVKNSCREKLSTVIYNSCKTVGAPDFSKRDHTPEMLKKLLAEKVSQTCPLFRAVHRRLLH
jgi:Domain of unknown function (DUF4276)